MMALPMMAPPMTAPPMTAPGTRCALTASCECTPGTRLRLEYTINRREWWTKFVSDGLWKSFSSSDRLSFSSPYGYRGNGATKEGYRGDGAHNA